MESNGNTVAPPPGNDISSKVDTFLTFEVEERLFSLPRSMLLTGEFFREMLTSPEIGSSEDGTLDHPIKLANISAFEMDCFTTLLNTRVFEPQRTFSYEEGGAILHLASLWGFTAVRRYILPSMTVVVNEMDVLDSIEEADKFEVQRWLVTAFVKLCMRPTPLTCEELERLGGCRAAALCEIREKRLTFPGFNDARVQQACTTWVKESSVLLSTRM